MVDESQLAPDKEDGPRDPSKLVFQTDRTRRSILLSYWTVFFLALPIWWYMTSIERLSLPSSRVVMQAEREPLFQIYIDLETSNAAHIANETQRLLLERSRLAPSRWRSLQVRVRPKQASVVEVPHDVSGTYTVVSRSGDPTLEHRRLYFPLADDNDSISKLVDILSALMVPHSAAPDQEHRVAQYAPRYRLSFTLLNEDSAEGNVVNGWDISSAISRHVSPIIESVSVLHNFTVESQVQFHAPLAFIPQSTSEGVDVLTPEDLTVFTNSAEWTLSSSVSNDPVLHFVLFIPSAVRKALHILNSNGALSSSNAFLLPQWGGIIIYNPPRDQASPHVLSSDHLDPIFSSFSNQLLALLGVPKLPDGVHAAESGTTVPVLTKWQLDAVLRRRTLKNVKGTQETLLSIVKLVEQIGNMPVGKYVKDDVQDALAALEKMYALSSTSLILSLHHSSRAVTLASRAFFNPGMLALLYFPAEHKYAVYTPLFASAIIPLIGAALRELWAWRQKRKDNEQRQRT